MTENELSIANLLIGIQKDFENNSFINEDGNEQCYSISNCAEILEFPDFFDVQKNTHFQVEDKVKTDLYEVKSLLLKMFRNDREKSLYYIAFDYRNNSYRYASVFKLYIKRVK